MGWGVVFIYIGSNVLFSFIVFFYYLLFFYFFVSIMLITIGVFQYEPWFSKFELPTKTNQAAVYCVTKRYKSIPIDFFFCKQTFYQAEVKSFLLHRLCSSLNVVKSFPWTALRGFTRVFSTISDTRQNKCIVILAFFPLI